MRALRSPRPAWLSWLLSFVALVLVTGVLFLLRGTLGKAHIALAYLLVVLVASAAGGGVLGVTLSVAAFLCFNYLFLPPYSTLVIADPLDWLVLVAFLVTGIVAAQLLSRAQQRAELARRRTQEVERLASLGAETLNVGRAEDALGAIAGVIRSALGVATCEILVPNDQPSTPAVGSHFPPVSLSIAARAAGGAGRSAVGADDSSGGLAAWVLGAGAPAARLADGTTWTGAAPPPSDDSVEAGWSWTTGDAISLLMPLRVRERTVGVLRLSHDAPIVLEPDARRFLDALAYYAALGVERVRLTAAAERAEAFRQADELKTALIATVSHDLRTPLTTIKALAHELAARGEEDALSIEEEADRLNGLVADLLDLSRLSAGELPLRIELDAVDDLVATTLDRLRGRSTGRTIRVARLDQDVSEEPILFARFDLAQSQRALVNLLENAIKYGPPDEPIELWIARVGDRVRLTVADRGPGIPEAERALIFEPFYRPKGTRPDVGGAGLGLAIARRIAEAQGGSLTYTTRSGGGSEFRFELPAGTAAELAYVHGHFMPDQP
ncbi:MAG TPA: ATP-binding protein [Gemmatimonadaceae bacterium]